MGFSKIHQKCRKCGGRGVLYRDTEPYETTSRYNDGLFSVVCDTCGEATLEWCRAGYAIRNWNGMNSDVAQELEKGGIK